MHLIPTLAILAAAAAPAPPPADLLALIKAGHANTREMIRSLQTEVVWDTVGGSDSSEGGGDHVRGSWWEESGRSRMVETRDVKVAQRPAQFTADVLIKGGEVSTIATQGSGEKVDLQSGSLDSAKDETKGLIDPWSRALFVLLDAPRKTFSELLDTEGAVTAIEPTSEGRHRIHLSIGDGVKMEVDVDPSRNFLVTRAVQIPLAGGLISRLEQEVVEFQEPEPGLYFPKAVEMRIFKAGLDQAWRLNRIRFEGTRLNRPIEASVFERDFPEGTSVVDNRSGTLVRWGKGGPASEPIPMKAAAPVAVEAAAGPGRVGVVVALNLAAVAALAAYWMLRAQRTPRADGA